ncbi:MAG: sugar phosphate isomerase/epimerase [Candidatus Aenigmarchaeota archaeon]|nr:sugar phosphate isomerase/epimerase [Candidatus Aenigmarchaeota archaeon]
MPIKFGLLTNPQINIIQEIKTIKDIGVDYVEVGIEWPGGSTDFIIENKDIIINLLGQFKHPPVGHTAWWIDLGNIYEIVRKSWVEEAKRAVDAAKALKLTTVNFHFYSSRITETYKDYHKEMLDNIVKSLKEVVTYAKKYKITVMYENAPLKKEVVGIKEYKYVIDKVPGLKVHLDIGHAFVENGMKGIKSYLATFGSKLHHIHIHDNSGEGDEHLPLGDGGINFRQVARWLKEIKYDRTLTFEVFTSKQDAKESILRFKELLPK